MSQQNQTNEATCSEENTTSRVPQVGDIWKDSSCGYERFVRVDLVGDERVRIKGVRTVALHNGKRWVATVNAKSRSTQLKRFVGQKPDFEFVESGS